jgi:hypothetical protein
VTPRRLRVLDLFAGLEGWASGFRERGHHVDTLDLDPSFGSTFTADVLEVTAADLGGPYDVVVASPPCEGFSVGSLYRHWEQPGGRGTLALPKSDQSRLGTRIALATIDLLADLAPPLGFVIENPTGMMRHVLGFDGGERAGARWVRWLHPDAGTRKAPSVTYCTLGMDYRKPTDLWVGGALLETLDLPAPCRTDAAESVVLDDGREFRVNLRTGEPCHEAARRGAKTGVQGLADYATRSLVPTPLSRAVALAAEAATPGLEPIAAPTPQPAQLDLGLG